MTGTRRNVSISERATLSVAGGSKVREVSISAAVRRRRTGGLPSQLEPDLARSGVADSTATRPFLGTLRPGPVMPELPRNERLPIFASSMCSQPPPSSYDATIVSSARKAPSPIVVNRGSTSAVEISVPSPTFAPRMRNHVGVSRLAYSGNRYVRAASRRRSVIQTCQPTRDRTG